MAYPVRVMKGIDVSLWQKEDYDFVAAKAEGYSFAIIKGGGKTCF